MSAILYSPNPFHSAHLITLNFVPRQELNMSSLQELGGCQSDLSLIEQGEGFRSCMYKDTMGIPTVCYGFNLNKGSAASQVAAVGGNYSSVKSGSQCLSQSQCEKLLSADVNTARSGQHAIYGSKVSCQCAKDVLVDMTYNLGQYGLSTFHTFNSLIEQGRWTEAASDLRTGTAWCGQVGNRCARNMNQIKMCN